MADVTLRAAERKAGAGPADAEVQARLLSERLRAGRISRGRVALLAYVGDQGARVLLGDQAPTPEFEVVREGRTKEDRDRHNEQWRRWKRVMAHVPREACLVAAAQTVLVVLDGLSSWARPNGVDGNGDRRAESALRTACIRFLEDPRDAAATVVLRALVGNADGRAAWVVRPAADAFRGDGSHVAATAELLRRSGTGTIGTGTGVETMVREALASWARGGP